MSHTDEVIDLMNRLAKAEAEVERLRSLLEGDTCLSCASTITSASHIRRSSATHKMRRSHDRQ
jgi:hypothetical protein